MGLTEIVLLIVVVIGIPLVIAVVVTLWSLKQVRYKPKRRAPRPAFGTTPPGDDTPGHHPVDSPPDPLEPSQQAPLEPPMTVDEPARESVPAG